MATSQMAAGADTPEKKRIRELEAEVQRKDKELQTYAQTVKEMDEKYGNVVRLWRTNQRCATQQEGEHTPAATPAATPSPSAAT